MKFSPSSGKPMLVETHFFWWWWRQSKLLPASRKSLTADSLQCKTGTAPETTE
jgi:hypothetical protein